MKSIVENAFIEAITSRGKSVRLTAGGDAEAPVRVHVILLSQDTQYMLLSENMAERKMTTIVEVRFEQAEDGEVLYRDILQRSRRDTVNNVPAGVIPSRQSFIERIAEPVVVISGAILIVYLFFTVRS